MESGHWEGRGDFSSSFTQAGQPPTLGWLSRVVWSQGSTHIACKALGAVAKSQARCRLSGVRSGCMGRCSRALQRYGSVESPKPGLLPPGFQGVGFGLGEEGWSAFTLDLMAR